jgi:hypothetical protein
MITLPQRWCSCVAHAGRGSFRLILASASISSDGARTNGHELLMDAVET